MTTQSLAPPPATGGTVVPTIVAGLTTWTAIASWSVLLEPDDWLRAAAVMVAAVTLPGLVLRHVGRSRVVVIPVQLVLGTWAWVWWVSGTPLPWGSRAAHLGETVRRAITASIHEVPPVEPSLVLPVVLAGVVLAAIVVDAIAVGTRRPAFAGLVLLGIWIVTLWNGPTPASAWLVVPTGLGWTTLLAMSRPMKDLAESWRSWLGEATTIAVVAVSSAALVAGTVPLSSLPWNGHKDHGIGPLAVSNPMVGLRKKLVLGHDDNLLRVATNDPDPSYLRIAVLVNFRDNEWTPGERSLPGTNTADGRLPTLLGVGSLVPRKSYLYDVTALPRFDERWLPTAAPIVGIRANGDWRYDASTMDFLAVDSKLSTASQHWSMSAVRLNLDTDQLRDLAPVRLIGEQFLELPASFPPTVASLAREVTSTALTPFDKAVALQRWFRTDGGFVYDTSVGSGDGTNTMVTFLAPGNRRGFCQQFASSMAAMARSLGIPARVAVGFLHPEKLSGLTADGLTRWMFSAHDLHAWPELYFQGAGWVRFEPTPQSRGAETPPYTDISLPPAPTPTSIPVANQPPRQVTPSATPPVPKPRTHSSTQKSHGALVTSVLGAIVASGLILAAIPGALRARRRRRRLRSPDPEAWWSELRDTAIDVGMTIPATHSVRRQAAAISTHLRRSMGVGAWKSELEPALTRLTTAVEIARYAEPGSTTAASSTADLAIITKALVESAGSRTQRRAKFFPATIISMD